MENHVNKPILRFPEFKTNWINEQLGSIAEFIGGGTPASSVQKYWKGKIPWISSSDLSEGDIHNINIQRYITEEAINESATKLIPINSILIVSRVGIGKFAVNTIPLCTSQDFTNMMIKDGNAFFYAYSLLANPNKLLSLSQGTSIKGFTSTEIKKAKFNIPSSAEQTKIASFFTSIDQKIQALKKKKTLLEEYKKAVMQRIFSQEIRFKQEDGADFPDWESKKLGEVLFEHLEKNKDGKFNEVFSVAKHKGVINQIEHLGRSFAAKEILHYKLIFPNDIVYTKSPTSDFPFGIIKQNLTGRIGVVSPLYGVFRPQTEALGFLLHNYFHSWVNVYNYLNPLVQKGAKNTMNINNADFLNGAELTLPVSQPEQAKIANFLSALDEKIEITSSQITGMETWKKGLLQQMFC